MSPVLRSASVPSPVADPRALYVAEVDYVWKTLRRFGAREADLEDLVHEVFITAIKRAHSFDAARSVRPWLAGIAFRVLSDFRRRPHNAREELQVEDADGVALDGLEARVEAEQRRKLLMRALDALDEGKRSVFVLHVLNEHPMPEVAEALGVPLNTAYSRLRLAKAELQSALGHLKEDKS